MLHRRLGCSSHAIEPKDPPMKIYKFEMYSHHGNRELQQTIETHAEVWNHFVAWCRRYYAIYSTYPGRQDSTDAAPDKVKAVASQGMSKNSKPLGWGVCQ